MNIMFQHLKKELRQKRLDSSGKSNHLRGIYGQFVLSHTLVLLLPVVLSLLLYFQSIDTVRTEIERANGAMLRQTQVAIDDRLAEIQRSALQLADNSKILQTVANGELDSANRIRYYTVMQELGDMMEYNSLVGNVYLFCNKFNKIITPTEQTERAIFYNEYHATVEMSYEEWLAIVDGIDEPCYRTLYINSNNTTERVIAYFQPIPSYQTQTPYGTLMILINKNEIKDIIQNMEWVNNGNIYVLDDNDQVLFSNTGQEEALPVTYNELVDEKQKLYCSVNGERVVVSYKAAALTDWKYVAVMPYNVFWKNVVYIRALFLLMGLLVLIAGGLLIRYVARKNYSPIRQILRNISEKSKQADNRWLNEYLVINDYLHDMNSETNRLKRVLEENQSLYRENFLSRLLTPGQWEDSLLERGEQELGISFKTPLFAVMIVRLDDFSSLFPDEEYRGQKAIDIVRFSVKNVLSEIFSKAFLIYVSELNGVITAILNPPDMLDDAAFEKTTADLLSYMREFFAENMQVYFTAAVSALHRNAQQIAQAHQEALSAMEYRLILGKNRTIFYTEVGKSPLTTYTYSLASEQKMVNGIVNGNSEIAMQVIEEIFEQSGVRQMDSLQTAKCLMYDMASTMLKVFAYVENDVLRKEIQPWEQITGCETLDDLKRCVQDMATRMATYFEEQKCSTRLSDRVREYVGMHYGDVDVNVNMLGDHFGITPSYLSKIFKKETGERLLDYISGVRIEAAKHLLSDTTKSVAEISTRVGYIDSNAFILAFKKKMGITPGQYRSNFQDMNSSRKDG